MNFVLAGILILVFIENSVSIQSKVLQLPDPIRGCYFTNWPQYRLGIWKFAPENIESDLCTHIFYAFVSMGEDFKIKSIDANDQDHNGTIGLYNRIDSIKKNQSDLKILLSFGGYEFARLNGPLMHKLMQNADNRKTFIDSAIDFVRLHKFDGFDFNWIPDTETKSDFVIFFQEFRQSIDAESDLNRQSPLLLTLGVPPGIDRIEAGYDGKALAESVDWMNVMTFDYHGQWENKTGFNSPLFDRDGDRLSINSTMMYLTENQEIPKDKLVIGFATYGRGWTLPSTSEPNSIPSPTVGLSPAQPFTLVPGVAAYFEICTLIEKENFTEKFDEMQDVPFIFDNGIWIGYDDPKSYDQKLDWLIDNDFAGAFVWALDMDDFLGRCSSSNGTYPLVKTVRSKLTRKE